MTVAVDFAAIFTNAQPGSCPVTTCSLKEPGCGAPLAPQPDVVLGASPFGITASETNAAGYSVMFCYYCEVGVNGQAPFSYFTKDSISITQLPVDCSSSMTSTSFPNPAAIPYNSAGSAVTIATDYTAIFTHTSQVDCPLVGCSLMVDTDCTTPLPAQTDVTLGASPSFGLTATELNSLGYT